MLWVRGMLEEGRGGELDVGEVLRCGERDVMGVLEELLAFEEYRLFEQVRKKFNVSDAQLIECKYTRELYRRYTQIDDDDDNIK